jgi:hypothetical protein
MKRRRTCHLSPALASAVLLAAISQVACLHDAPKLEITEQTKDCVGTESGNTCLVLHFFTTESTRKHADLSHLTGLLHWGVYREGDVSGFGPGDNVAVFSGDTTEMIDFSHSEDFYEITIPNAPAKHYQALGYVGPSTPDKKAASGDPVTLPSDSFATTPNQRVVAMMALNFVR